MSGPTCPTSRPTSRHITTPRSTSGAGSSAASPWRSICPKIGSTRGVTKPPSQLRLVHYPPDPGVDPNSTGIGAHTDYEVFTILHTTGPGLEVLNARGAWIDAPPIDGAFVVNIGDMFEVLTNGAWVSTTHRVRKVSRERYSLPFFFNFDYRTRVEPLARFVGASGPRYGTVLAGDHLLAQTMQSFMYLKRAVDTDC